MSNVQPPRRGTNSRPRGRPMGTWDQNNASGRLRRRITPYTCFVAALSVAVRVRKNAARAPCEIGERRQTTPLPTGDGRGRYSSSGLCRVACASVPRARVAVVHFLGGSSSSSSFRTSGRVSPSSVRHRAPPEHASPSARPSPTSSSSLGAKGTRPKADRLVRLVAARLGAVSFSTAPRRASLLYLLVFACFRSAPEHTPPAVRFPLTTRSTTAVDDDSNVLLGPHGPVTSLTEAGPVCSSCWTFKPTIGYVNPPKTWGTPATAAGPPSVLGAANATPANDAPRARPATSAANVPGDNDRVRGQF